MNKARKQITRFQTNKKKGRNQNATILAEKEARYQKVNNQARWQASKFKKACTWKQEIKVEDFRQVS